MGSLIEGIILVLPAAGISMIIYGKNSKVKMMKKNPTFGIDILRGKPYKETLKKFFQKRGFPL